jgi:hypothetical protein
MSGALMETLSPYRDRIVECADNVEDTFPKNREVALFMAGARFGADMLMYSALMDGNDWFDREAACSDMIAWTAFGEASNRSEGDRE